MKEDCRNYALIKGLVDKDAVFDHEFHGEKFYRFTVLTERLSGFVDELPVIVSEQLINEDDIVEDAVVNICGEIRTQNYYSVEEDKRKTNIYLFANEIDVVGVYDGMFTDVNEVSLTGYICKKSELRKTPKGRHIIDVILAVNRNYGHDKADYIPIICWGRNAHYVDGFPINAKVTLNGRFQSREYLKRYDDESIVTKTIYEVSASEIKEDKEDCENVEEK